MKPHAVVFTKPNTVEYLQVDCPEPQGDGVVVNTLYSWISNGTESSYLRGERIEGDKAYEVGDPVPFPIVPGYQQVGVVEKVGKDIKDLAVGDLVFCAFGAVNGMFCDIGGHVSPAVSKRDWIWKIPNGVDPLAFSGLVLAQVGYNCATRVPVEKGQIAVVIGDGLVGQWTSQVLSYLGAEVIMLGRNASRLKHIKYVKRAKSIDVSNKNWLVELNKLTLENLSIIVDTAGSIPTIEKIMPQLIFRGHIVSAGFYGSNDKFAIQPMRDKEISLSTVSGLNKERMNATLELIAQNHIQTLPLITHHFPVSKVAEAWTLITERTEPFLGVILDWRQQLLN
jgi:2-desacetyl-2-hydroxyethyl bacteriochlorophyllide A dehydrogenase